MSIEEIMKTQIRHQNTYQYIKTFTIDGKIIRCYKCLDKKYKKLVFTTIDIKTRFELDITDSILNLFTWLNDYLLEEE